MEIVTVKEAAQILGCSDQTIYNLIKDKSLIALRMNKYYIPLESLKNTEQFITSAKNNKHKKEDKFKIEIGTRFHMLTVISEPYKRYREKRYSFICRCDCGKILSVSRGALTMGNNKSCGCARYDTQSETMKKTWRESYVDGINVPRAINNKLNKNNTSGCRGVQWQKNSKKWFASIYYNGKLKNLGYYINKEDAIAARKKAEEEIYNPAIEKFIESKKHPEA